ncbi:MFS transporter [Streptomyces sp. NBC_00669]|uniref:MFS transporter n=1 Tax=unclassified Streptomyces TaxID=2593676 RepID=UPI002E327CA5|nr:MFS transporter [Streptomyces sp. NBC_00669]
MTTATGQHASGDADGDAGSEGGGAGTGSALRTGTIVAALFAVCLAQIGLAMPATLNGTFQEVFEPSSSQLTWISDCSLLPITVLELTCGVLGDLFGRKRLLLGGAAMLALGEAISAAAHGIGVMWTGQIIAGIGCAALFPTTLAMLVAGERTPAQRAKMIALWAAILSTGNFLAPLLGGITATYLQWRWAFLIVVVLALGDAVITYLAAQDSRSPAGRSLDPLGQTTVGLGLCALLFGVIQGASDGWGSGTVVGAFALSAVCLAAFVVVELRVRDPLLRLDLFRSRTFALASAVTVVGMFAFLGTAYSISLRMGPIQGQSSMRTAVAFLLLSGLTIFLLPLTHRLMAVLEPRWVLGLGFLLMAVGDFLAGRMPITDSALPSLIVPMGLVGVGFSFAVSAVTATAVETVPHGLAGMASATTSMLRDFGFTLGPAVIGAVATANAVHHFSGSLAASTLGAADQAKAHGILSSGGPVAVLHADPPASGLAFKALGHAYALGFEVCAVAALACCLVTALLLRPARQPDTPPLAAPAAPAAL